MATVVAVLIGGASPAGADVRWVGFNEVERLGTVHDDVLTGLSVRAGGNVARVAAHWGSVQPDGDKNDWYWGHYDRLMTSLRAHGMRVIFTVIDPPAWAVTAADRLKCSPSERNPDGLCFSPPDVAHISHWKAFVRHLVTRYPDTLAVEVWNEPNLGCWWGYRQPDPIHYGMMLREAFKAVNEVNPGVQVLTGGLNGTPHTGTGVCGGYEMSYSDFLTEVYERAKGHFDGIGAHVYPWKKSAETEFTTRVIDESRRISREFGDAGRPLWLDEIGVTRICSDPCYGDVWTQQEQADWLLGLLQRLRHQPDIHMVGFHNLVVTARDAGYGFLNNDPGFTPFPVYCGLAEAMRSGFSCGGYNGNDTTPPDTTITEGPGDTSHGVARVAFASSDPHPVFECRLDAGAWSLCPATSGYKPGEPQQFTFHGLASGSHTVQVRAFDRADNGDPSPAELTFQVQRSSSLPGGASGGGIISSARELLPGR